MKEIKSPVSANSTGQGNWHFQFFGAHNAERHELLLKDCEIDTVIKQSSAKLDLRLFA